MQVTITKIELIVACESISSEGSIEEVIHNMSRECEREITDGLIHLDSGHTTIAEVEWNLEGVVV